MVDKNYYIVSFSGGKDSTAMLLKLIEENRPIDEIIFIDTGLEFDEMYEHIKKVEEFINRKITILKSDKTFEYYAFEHILTKGKNKGQKGYGFPSPRVRWCNSKLKIDIFNNYVKGKVNVKRYIGIAFDEQERIKEDDDKIYPLVEWKMSEKDCLKYCLEKGFNWNGLYRIFNRVSCWCCPLQSLSELRNLKMFFPEKWEKLKKWQELTNSPFRVDYSVFDLEKRFNLEEKFLRKKEFYKELEKELKRKEER